MNRLVLIVLIAILSSCKVYKQDIMFRLDKNFTKDDLSMVKDEIESNYKLAPNDAIRLDVFTNDGERLIDPNMELVVGQGMQQGQFRNQFQYIIQSDGIATFPMIGDVKLEGITLFEAERIIAKLFDDVYKDSFVKLQVNNRRVFVLGASGGQVVPLPNENTSIIEVLSTAGGLNFGAKAQNIRLIRNESVFQINLATITGLKETNMKVVPGDVIYVEPWRRPWLETLRDVSPALSLVSSVLTLLVVVQNL